MGSGLNISGNNHQNELNWVQSKLHDSQDKVDQGGGEHDLGFELEHDDGGSPKAIKRHDVELRSVDLGGEHLDVEGADDGEGGRENNVEAEGTTSLKESLGTASRFAKFKDALMRAFQKITHPFTKVDDAVGSYHKAALRYAEQYDAAKTEGRCTPEYLASLLMEADREISGHFANHPEELRASKEVIEQEREYIRNLKFGDGPDVVNGLPSDLGDKTALRDAMHECFSGEDGAHQALADLLTNVVKENYDEGQIRGALTSQDMAALKEHLKDHLRLEGIFLRGAGFVQNEKGIRGMIDHACTCVALNLKDDVNQAINDEIDHVMGHSNLTPTSLDGAGKLNVGGTDYTSLNRRAGLSSIPGSVMVYESNAGDKVVLKRLDVSMEDGSGVSANRLMEAKGEIEAHLKMQSSGGHDNVVGLKGLCRGQDGNIYMVLAYADGGSVGDMVEKVNAKLAAKTMDATLARNVKLTMLKDMAKGLAYTHNVAGVVHGDIKAPNFFLSKDGVAKLGDFGTSWVGTSRMAQLKGKALDGEDTFATRYDRVPDSPYNVSPEMTRQMDDPHNKGGARVAPSSDAWAYGMAAFYMLNGEGTAVPKSLRNAINSLVAKNIVQRADEGGALVPIPSGDPAVDDQMSADERDFVNWVTNMDAANRPTMDQILQHQFLTDLSQNDEDDARAWMANNMG